MIKTHHFFNNGNRFFVIYVYVLSLCYLLYIHIYIYIYIYINIMRGKKDVTTFPDKPVS